MTSLMVQTRRAVSSGFLGGQLQKRGYFQLPPVKNETAVHYAPGSEERSSLEAAVREAMASCPEIPCVVGGKEVWSGKVGTQLMPSRQGHAVCRFHNADGATMEAAAAAAVGAKEEWEKTPVEARLQVFRKAADLLSSARWRHKLMAATMVGQGKNG